MIWVQAIVLAFLLCHPPVVSLRCYYCHSYYSWADCDQHQQPYDCHSNLDVCYTAHRVLTYQSGKQVHDFLRTCFHSSLCTSDGCQETEDDGVTGTWCQYYCCNTTLCNALVTPWAKRRGFVMMELSSNTGNSVTSGIANPLHLFVLILPWML